MSSTLRRISRKFTRGCKKFQEKRNSLCWRWVKDCEHCGFLVNSKLRKGISRKICRRWLSRLEPHSTVNQGFLLTSINCFCDSENCLVGQLKQTATAPDIACRAACKWSLRSRRDAHSSRYLSQRDEIFSSLIVNWRNVFCQIHLSLR